MHNRPGLAVGKFATRAGAYMAGGAFFDIAHHRQGRHGARPEASIDPVVVAAHLTAALQTIVARNVPPADIAVLSVTRIASGDAYNVIPQTATMGGTARTLRRETMELVEQGMRRLATGIAAGFGASAEVDFRFLFAPLVNDAAEAGAMADAAAAVVGEAAVERNSARNNASEDFSFMLEQGRGALINLGNGGGAGGAQPGLRLQRRGHPLRGGAVGHAGRAKTRQGSGLSRGGRVTDSSTGRFIVVRRYVSAVVWMPRGQLRRPSRKCRINARLWLRCDIPGT